MKQPIGDLPFLKVQPLRDVDGIELMLPQLKDCMIARIISI